MEKHSERLAMRWWTGTAHIAASVSPKLEWQASNDQMFILNIIPQMRQNNYYPRGIYAELGYM